MSGKWIYWLEELGKEHNDLVGKKCAHLGEIAKIGLPVPHGFALSVDAYTYFMEETGSAREIASMIEASMVTPEDIDGLNRLSSAIRQAVESKQIPSELESAILSYYDGLCEKCKCTDVAVSTRSAGAVSHPGQYETYLNVKGKADLLQKVRRVWASTFNARSVAYRLRKGLAVASGPIGVAVLEMVKARSAGIAFSVDPNTGDETRMIVEANWGLGESVVSGELTPDRWVLDKETLAVKENILGRKEKFTCVIDTGVVAQETPAEKSCAFCCSEAELAEIGRLTKELEKHFGTPQDIEWAIAEDRPFPNVVLLQARSAVVVKKTAADSVVDMMLTMFRN
ncbi:MAG: PEP/pyruvate-binding domain-containing protein [Syntrophorhabdales bacterium]|jgi:pyruvate,water dikinase